MRLIARLVIFALALLFGLVAWYALARAQVSSAQNTNATVTTNANMSGNMNGNINAGTYGSMNRVAHTNTSPPGAGSEREGPGDEHAGSPPSIKWSEFKPVGGYANAERLTLRSRPDSSAPAVATLEPYEYAEVQILDSTREHLRVRFAVGGEPNSPPSERDHVGWVEWGAVQPHMSAIVLDAESGEVVGRLPLSGMVSAVAYSPDGSRAIFYGDAYGESDITGLAYEVDTESYRIVRAFETSAGASFTTVLYGESGDEIHALSKKFIDGGNNAVSNHHSFRVRGDHAEAANEAPRPALSGNLIMSPDGLSGLVIHGAGASEETTRMDVIDLKTMQVRHSVEVEDVGGGWWPSEYAVSWDGSKFYFRDPSPDEGEKIVAVDTRTGRRVGETPLRLRENHWAAFTQESLVGDSLLIKAWQTDGEGEEAQSQSLWLRPGGEPVAAESDIHLAAEAGGSRYAVDETGTRLFKLDPDNRIRETLRIDRPEAKFRPDAEQDLTVLKFIASPDGKHLIVLVGMVCGC